MILFGSVVVVPDGAGIGVVSVSDAARMVYFDPQRFASPWAVPLVDDVVAVAPGVPFWTAINVIKLGAPSYVFGGD